jgi:hypothetical protein
VRVTITINKNTVIFVVALIALAVVGYFVGTQVMGRPGGQAGPAQVTATLPAEAAALAAQAGQPQAALPTPVPDTAPRIEMDAFKQEYDQKADVLVVDVRTPDQFAAGHIAGAINVPEADVEKRLADLPKGKRIVLYCA